MKTYGMKDFFLTIAFTTMVVVGLMLPRVPAADPKKSEIADLALYAPDCNYTIHQGFVVGKPDRTGCPRWTLEVITADRLEGPGKRLTSSFHSAADGLPERHARDLDYLLSGKSRGHLSPADFHHASQSEMDDCHSLDNVVPQAQVFNAQAWEHFEQYAKSLVVDDSGKPNGVKVRRVVIPIWKPEKHSVSPQGHPKGTLLVETIGEGFIWVPTHLACSLLIETKRGGDPSGGVKSGTAARVDYRIESYLAPNSDRAAKDDFRKWRVATDTIEGLGVVDLWSGIPNEKQLEKEQ